MQKFLKVAQSWVLDRLKKFLVSFFRNPYYQFFRVFFVDLVAFDSNQRVLQGVALF